MYKPRLDNSLKKNLFMQIIFFAIVFLCWYFICDYLHTHFASDNSKQFKLLLKELQNFKPYQSEIFFYCLYKQIKYIVLLFFFSAANLWNFCWKGFLGYIALSQSFLFTLCYRTNGLMGIPEYFLFLFPECLVFIPLYLYLYCHLQTFHEACMHTSSSHTPFAFLFDAEKKRVLKRELPVILCLIPVLIFGAFLETYLGLPVLQIFHKHLLPF